MDSAEPVARDVAGLPACDDATLIAQSLRAPERFGVLFDRHAPAIFRYAARRLGPDAADDIVAETFLTAFRARGRYDPAYLDAGPWLYGIATSSGPYREELIFAPGSYRFIGSRAVVTRPEAGLPAGTVIVASSLIRAASPAALHPPLPARPTVRPQAACLPGPAPDRPRRAGPAAVTLDGTKLASNTTQQ